MTKEEFAQQVTDNYDKLELFLLGAANLAYDIIELVIQPREEDMHLRDQVSETLRTYTKDFLREFLNIVIWYHINQDTVTLKKFVRQYQTLTKKYVPDDPRNA